MLRCGPLLCEDLINFNLKVSHIRRPWADECEMGGQPNEFKDVQRKEVIDSGGQIFNLFEL